MPTLTPVDHDPFSLSTPQVWRPPADPYALTGAQQVGAAIPGALGTMEQGAVRPIVDSWNAVDNAMHGVSQSQGSQMDAMIGLGGMMAAPGSGRPAVASTGAGFDLQGAFSDLLAGREAPPLDLKALATQAVREQGANAAAAHLSRSETLNPSGLPMDQASRYARARDMGFDTVRTLYHGTDQTFDAFRDNASGVPLGEGRQAGTFFGDDPGVTDYYAMAGRENGGQVLPVFARMRNPLEAQYDPSSGNVGAYIDRARAAGHDSLVLHGMTDNYGYAPIGGTHDARAAAMAPQTQYVIFDPANIRSRSAVFDPAASASADLLRTGGGPPLYQLPNGLTVDANGVPQT